MGIGMAQLLHFFVPALPVKTPVEYICMAVVVSLLVGLVSGILPARRASRLDPVVALAEE
jgi:putative ABC transport system permease protein